MISNRGVRVWPEGFPETLLSDHWRCRFLADGAGGASAHQRIVRLLERFERTGLDFIKTENLCRFDGKVAYSSEGD